MEMMTKIIMMRPRLANQSPNLIYLIRHGFMIVFYVKQILKHRKETHSLIYGALGYDHIFQTVIQWRQILIASTGCQLGDIDVVFVAVADTFNPPFQVQYITWIYSRQLYRSGSSPENLISAHYTQRGECYCFLNLVLLTIATSCL